LAFSYHSSKVKSSGAWPWIACLNDSFYGSKDYPPITYYWTVSLILNHSYIVGKLTSLKIADT
jgi:hypothetical protein